MPDRTRQVDPYRPMMCASSALDAVEQWADGCYLLRETGQVVPDCRLDGLLVPARWGARIKRGLAGIEVKLRRPDFLRGLKNGQYEKYRKQVSCLYLATTRDVCKTAEVPEGIGHLIVGFRPGVQRSSDEVCVCRRRAVWREVQYSQESLWDVIWDLFDQSKRQQDEDWLAIDRAKDTIGGVAERIIAGILSNVAKGTENA